MKRSRKLALTSLMALSGVSLTACGDDPNVAAGGQEPQVDAFAYQSLQECKDKNEVPDDACATAEKTAGEEGAAESRYSDAKTCEDVYGAGQCVPRSQAGGGSFWGPLVAGFVVGRMMDGAWGGRGLYNDRYGGYYTRNGGRLSTDYATGRTRIGARSFDAPDLARPPERVQTRSSVISRGGFGGRMASRSGGSGWGG